MGGVTINNHATFKIAWDPPRAVFVLFRSMSMTNQRHSSSSREHKSNNMSHSESSNFHISVSAAKKTLKCSWRRGWKASWEVQNQAFKKRRSTHTCSLNISAFMSVFMSFRYRMISKQSCLDWLQLLCHFWWKIVVRSLEAGWRCYFSLWEINFIIK